MVMAIWIPKIIERNNKSKISHIGAIKQRKHAVIFMDLCLGKSSNHNRCQQKGSLQWMYTTPPRKVNSRGTLDFKKIFEKGKSFDVARLSVMMKSFFLGTLLVFGFFFLPTIKSKQANLEDACPCFSGAVNLSWSFGKTPSRSAFHEWGGWGEFGSILRNASYAARHYGKMVGK